jgi:NADH-quinone oxidoreductase subunit G
VEWETALEAVAKGLKEVIARHGADAVGFLVSPTATVEELYLAQKLARGLGVANIDHRLRQADFSDQDTAPVFPWLGQGVADLEKSKRRCWSAATCGWNSRWPVIACARRRWRGVKLMFVNPRDLNSASRSRPKSSPIPPGW